MKLVIFLGPPGVGKGTQCSLLNSRLGFKHISTGSIIRKEIQSCSELGLRVKNLVESGNLVDDKTIFLCLEKALNELSFSSEATILLDGLPRNLSQARDLEVLVQKYSFESVRVISLKADMELLTQRFNNRVTCSVCGNVDSLEEKNIDNVKTYSCKACNSVGSMYRRKDDEVSTVRHRLDLYQKETLPLVSFYEEKNIINFVDGLMHPEFVYVRVASFLI